MNQADTARVAPLPALLVTVILLLMAASFAIQYAVATPGMGLQLSPAQNGTGVQIRAASGPAQVIAPPASLVALASVDRSQRIVVKAQDLIDDPLHINDYASLQTFYARQSQINALLKQPELTVAVATAQGEAIYLLSPQERDSNNLPLRFWVLLLVGMLASLMGIWVWGLYPTVLAARLFAVLCVAVPFIGWPVAMYGSRELAMDGDVFRVLVSLNHLGRFAFGGALLGLLLSYPRALVSPRTLWLIPALLLPWLIADLCHWAPDQLLGAHVPIAAPLCLAAAVLLVQVALGRSDPKAGAGLLWPGLGVLAALGLMMVIESRPGLLAAMDYTHGPLLSLLPLLGLAVGLQGPRLYAWQGRAMRVLWLILVLLGALLVQGGLSRWLATWPALLLALVVVALVLAPLRARLLRSPSARQQLEDGVLVQGLIGTAIAADTASRQVYWHKLLQRVYQTEQIAVQSRSPYNPVVEDEGLTLLLPHLHDLPAVSLAQPWQGRHLLWPADARHAGNLLRLADAALQARETYDQRVRADRQAARADAFQGLSARLSETLHDSDIANIRLAVHLALDGQHDAIEAQPGHHQPLAQVLSALREQLAAQLGGTDVQLDWTLDAQTLQGSLGEQEAARLADILRELASNTVRHANAQHLAVQTACAAGSLQLVLVDDGKGFDAASRKPGLGLAHLARWVAEAGGQYCLQASPAGVRCTVTLPVLTTEA